MDQFDAFDIRAWTESALVIWDKKLTATAVEVVSHLKRAAGAAVVASVGALASLTASAATPNIDAMWSVSSFAPNQAPEGDSVPVGYWTDLIASMHRWKPVAENQVAALPAPFL